MRPSVTANTLASSPSSNSSITMTWPARRGPCRRGCPRWRRRAAAWSPVTVTPLPAASPSALTTRARRIGEGGDRRGRVGEGLGAGRWHPGGGHDLLGERLGALDAGGGGGRAEHRQAAVEELVRDPGDQGLPRGRRWSGRSAWPRRSWPARPRRWRQPRGRSRPPRPCRRCRARRTAGRPRRSGPGLPAARARARRCRRPDPHLHSLLIRGLSPRRPSPRKPPIAGVAPGGSARGRGRRRRPSPGRRPASRRRRRTPGRPGRSSSRVTPLMSSRQPSNCS